MMQLLNSVTDLLISDPEHTIKWCRQPAAVNKTLLKVVGIGDLKKIELKLIGIARASLEELLQDYEDYIRQNDLTLWRKDDERIQKIRQIGLQQERSYKCYRTYVEDPSNETAANTIISLVHQTNYLLDQQLRKLEKDFLNEGGITERMYNLRRKKR